MGIAANLEARVVFGLLAAISIGLNAVVPAQLTVTPGPGGGPIAPGAPVSSYTPGGVGLGGTPIAPGDAARDVPMYRYGIGGVPILVLPEPNAERRSLVIRRPLGCGGGRPCLPQGLALTIDSHGAGAGQSPPPDAPIGSIAQLFAALRTCWAPPAPNEAQEGMQMTVRFSYRQSGEIIAAPFVTYTKPGTTGEVKQTYRRAIDEALDRCNRLSFSTAFKSAIAGHPISVRYVDDRRLEKTP